MILVFVLCFNSSQKHIVWEEEKIVLQGLQISCSNNILTFQEKIFD